MRAVPTRNSSHFCISIRLIDVWWEGVQSSQILLRTNQIMLLICQQLQNRLFERISVPVFWILAHSQHFLAKSGQIEKLDWFIWRKNSIFGKVNSLWIKNIYIFVASKGGLAQLARAFDWQSLYSHYQLVTLHYISLHYIFN